MIYKFKSKADGDVVMLQATGDKVLAVIGKERTAQGILEPGQMAAALAALEAAVKAEEEAAAEGASDAPHAPDAISLRRRVWPLVEMIRRSEAADTAITWGV